MSYIKTASSASKWRGYDYYKDKKVKEYKKVHDGMYMGIVAGSGDELYVTGINLEHPRKSTCTCPHADGRMIICKHKVALYFTAFPEEAEKFYNDAMAAQEAYEDEQIEKYNDLTKCISKMKKDELREAVWFLLNCGPEWLYDKFVDRYVDVWKYGYYE